jgi:type III pantothenate kinase
MKDKKFFLSIDVGNSNIVFGIFKDEKVTSEFRIATSLDKTSDEIGIQFLNLLKNELGTNPVYKSDKSHPNLDLNLNLFYGCAIASVVPRLTEVVQMAIKQYIGIDSLIIDASLSTGIKLKVESPQQVGADRICNCVAGFKKYKSPLIIIDIGTAINFEVVSKKGEFLGGIIQPGPGTMVRALELKAAKLPSIELKFPDKVIGMNTVTNIQSGILFSLVHSTLGLVKQIEKELNEKCKVILTGGYAELFSPKLSIKHVMEPDLLLEGIKIVYDMTA